MTARDDAVRAMAAGRRDARERGGVDEDDVLGLALDAVPANVLARYLIERGGLEQVNAVCASRSCEHTKSWHSEGHCNRAQCDCPEFVPVYRIAEEPS